MDDQNNNGNPDEAGGGANQRLSVEQLREMAESTSDWFWESGPDHRFTFFSARMQEAFDGAAPAFLGRARVDVGDMSWHPENWVKHQDDLKHHRAFRNFVYRAYGPDGRAHYIRVTGRPFFAEDGSFAGYRGSGTIVTDEIEAKLEAERARNLLEDAIEALSDGLLLFDKDDRLLLCNKAYRKSAGPIAETLQAGATFESISRGLVDAGLIPEAIGREDEWMAARMAKHRDVGGDRRIEISLNDGRHIQVNEYTTRDGGSVVVRTDISEVRRQQSKAAEAAQRLKALFDETFQFIGLLDVEGRVLEINRTALSFIDTPIEQLRGLPFWDCRWWTHDPAAQAQLQDAIARAAKGEFVRFETTHTSPDGHELVVDFSLKPIRDEQGNVTMLLPEGRDITERREADRRLQRKSDLFNLLHRTAAAANQAHRFIDALAVCLHDLCKYTGWPVGHVYVRAPGDEVRVVSSSIWHLADEQRYAAFKGPTEATEFGLAVGLPGRVLARGQTVFIPDVSKDPGFVRADVAAQVGLKGGLGVPILIGTRVMAVMEFFCHSDTQPEPDLMAALQHVGTQLGRVAEREEALADLNEALQQADSASKAKSEFLAAMSHELRTPLNAILGFSDAIRSGAIGGEVSEVARGYVNHIHEAGQRLLVLINELLDFSRIESGTIDIHPEQVDIEEFLEELEPIARILARRNGNRFSVDFPAKPGQIRTDPARLRQVLVNLLGNAGKFTENGLVKMSFRWDQDEDGEPVAVFSVSDTGIGIREEDIGRLFQPFTQADMSVTRRYGGTGLGLSICRHFSRLLGGEVTVQSVFGEGSVFTLTLPITGPLDKAPASAD